jgi:hypothetical protein
LLVEAARGWNETAAWVRSSATLAQSSDERYSMLRDAAVATVVMVLLVGMSTPDRLRCLLT